jgi:hypothetical protein
MTLQMQKAAINLILETLDYHLSVFIKEHPNTFKNIHVL